MRSKNQWFFKRFKLIWYNYWLELFYEFHIHDYRVYQHLLFISASPHPLINFFIVNQPTHKIWMCHKINSLLGTIHYLCKKLLNFSLYKYTVMWIRCQGMSTEFFSHHMEFYGEKYLKKNNISKSIL